ncbi:MAG: alpha/beta hydrolase-fold protein [Treponema sp.]|nr:alpha/beta hydrolase-fold protein [Treponema sp.]
MTRFSTRSIRGFVCCLVLALAIPVVPVSAQMTARVNYFTSNSVTSDLYIPSSYNGVNPIPLMVMAHGCSQTKTTFKNCTLMNDVAEEKGFATLYIDGVTNIAMCWEYWHAKTQSRTAQVCEGIANIVNKVKTEYKIDSNNVWLGGFSSGAGLAVNMAAVYPDMFTGIVVAAGLPFGNSQSLSPSITAAASAAKILEAAGTNKRLIRVLVTHGSWDLTVPQDASVRVSSAFATVFKSIDPNVDTTVTSTTGSVNGTAHTRYVYAKLNGEELVVYYNVTGLTHGWMGGSGSDYSHSVARGAIDANRIAYDFFYKPLQ